MRLRTSRRVASRGLALLVVVYTGAHLATRDSAATSSDERSCQAPCQQLVAFGTRSSVPTSQQLRASRALLGQTLPSPSLADVAGPTEGSNWLVPGHLIIGAKPTAADAEALLGAGVSTFCSLIGEWAPARYHEREYPAVLARQSRAHRDGGLRWQGLLDHARLRRRRGEPQLYRRRQVPGGPLATVDAVFLHFGIVDFDAARPAALEALVIELRRRLLDGEVIYLHCRGGHGRTGTVAIPLLASVFGAPTEAVEAYVNWATREGRPLDRELIRQGARVELPETEAQRESARVVSSRLRHLAVAVSQLG